MMFTIAGVRCLSVNFALLMGCHFGDLLDGDSGLFAMCLVDVLIITDASRIVKSIRGINWLMHLLGVWSSPSELSWHDKCYANYFSMHRKSRI